MAGHSALTSCNSGLPHARAHLEINAVVEAGGQLQDLLHRLGIAADLFDDEIDNIARDVLGPDLVEIPAPRLARR